MSITNGQMFPEFSQLVLIAVRDTMTLRALPVVTREREGGREREREREGRNRSMFYECQ